MSKQWTNDEIIFLKENYKTMTYKHLSEKLDRSKAAIDLKINRLGLKKDKYTYDHDYFENIDTPQKAYWLGFIYADGGVYINEKTNSCELSIKLQASDCDHLRKFNKALNGNVDVTFDTRKCNLNDKLYDCCQIRFYSSKLVHDLSKHGVIPNKTLAIKFPDIDKELYTDFIRGYFDGDGCVYENKKKNGQSSIAVNFTCGSVEFLQDIRSVLYENGICSYITTWNDKTSKLIIGGMKNTHHFLYYIYKNKSEFLERKYKKTIYLYEHLDIEQRLLRHSETSGSFISEKENGNPEMGIRVEGCV
nr:MAG TPA: LAGLIDADG-like domain [Caudoviricetes sp.]